MKSAEAAKISMKQKLVEVSQAAQQTVIDLTSSWFTAPKLRGKDTSITGILFMTEEKVGGSKCDPNNSKRTEKLLEKQTNAGVNIPGAMVLDPLTGVYEKVDAMAYIIEAQEKARRRAALRKTDKRAKTIQMSATTQSGCDIR